MSTISSFILSHMSPAPTKFEWSSVVRVAVKVSDMRPYRDPHLSAAGLPKRKFAAQWLRDYLEPGSQTQGSIEIAAERDGVCISTLRRAKFDLGICSH
jgi:hypothetical protein